VPNFAQIGQETWTLPEEIYNFEVKYGCWWHDLKKNQAVFLLDIICTNTRVPIS
jgi:hypothetical protein